jgi:hypothetical protein
MATRWGTSHFESLAAAEKYYRCYGVTKDNVGRKIAEGEIHIGKPELKSGQTLRLDEDRRYWIEEPEHWLDRHIAEQRANYKAAGVSDEMLASAADYSEADEVRDAAKKADKPITQLACACCGGVTRGRQWFNQDSGYGICGDCIAWLRKPKSDTGPARESEEYIRDCYGIEGKHFNVA